MPLPLFFKRMPFIPALPCGAFWHIFVKRFFRVFPLGISWAFRKVLKVLFIWRLKIKKPEVIMLTLDTMPMDNDEAEEREGVSVTYKGYKGFQPLQIIWERKSR